jgi:hypothetical protein
MRKLIPVLFLLFITVAHAQEVKLRLSSGLDSLRFHQTTLKEAKKLLGKPDSIHKTNFDIDIFYHKLGLELLFGKRIKNELWCIALDKNSHITINDSIKINSTDTIQLARLWGPPKEKDRRNNFIEFEYGPYVEPSESFYFNNKGILYMVILSSSYVISVDF